MKLFTLIRICLIIMHSLKLMTSFDLPSFRWVHNALVCWCCCYLSRLVFRWFTLTQYTTANSQQPFDGVTNLFHNNNVYSCEQQPMWIHYISMVFPWINTTFYYNTHVPHKDQCICENFPFGIPSAFKRWQFFFSCFHSSHFTIALNTM